MQTTLETRFMSSTGGRMRTLAIIAALLSFLAALLYIRPSSLDAQADLRADIGRCAGCHGRVGRSVDPHVPNLAGQNVEYLVNQLQRFAHLSQSDFIDGVVRPPVAPDWDRSRQRRSELMEQHTDGLSGGILRDVALYYSKLPCVQAAKIKPVPSSYGIPWCADCHSSRTAQRIPSIPFIYGQNTEYLEAQLLAFKRSASGLGDKISDTRSHHFMNRSLRDVPDERLREVAQYYSQLSCLR
jgi:cytochrome c553